MSDRRRSRTLLAVLVLVSLVLLTVDYRQGEGGSIAAVQRGALAVAGPIQEGFSRVVRPVGGFFSGIGDLWRLREENASLLAELEALREGRVSVAYLEQENAELRAQLAMRERLGYTTTGAQVIAQPPGPFDWTVLIDIGAAHGVEVGMAVIDGDGFVGKIVEVTRNNARVELLASPNANYVVRVAASGEDGLLSGRGSRPLQLEIRDPEAEVPADVEVVTKVFQGTTIPDGIPVGVVEGPLGRVGGGGPRYLAVRPYVDFSRLNLVQVILDGPEHPADLPSDELVEPADQPRPPPPPSPEPEPPPAADPEDTEAEDAEE